MTTLYLLVLASQAALAAAPAAPLAKPGAPAAPAAAAVALSTAAVSPSTIYTGERLRDPFIPFGAGGGVAPSKPFNIEDFSIHNLSLRGIMKDSAADYALFTDKTSGATFILRRGKLYDPKNKIVRSVSGRLKVKEKWAELETPDHDVQVFRLGEEEKE